jgi:hypothetical protein
MWLHYVEYAFLNDLESQLGALCCTDSAPMQLVSERVRLLEVAGYTHYHDRAETLAPWVSDGFDAPSSVRSITVALMLLVGHPWIILRAIRER